MWTCALCSSHNDGYRVRCSTCGAQRRASDKVARPAGGETARHARSMIGRVPPSSAAFRLPPGDHESAEAYLVAPVLEIPFPLHRSHAVHLGRGPENHIILPVQQVSRHHASILWANDGFYVMDRGSKNGTTVNGESVIRRRLEERDVIGIGPIQFIFGARLVEASERTVHGETAHEGIAASSSFAGALDQLGLADVWQMLELGQKTGRLVVQRSEKRGTIYFVEGRSIHAELGSLRGEPAALELLLLEGGVFRFFPGTSPGVDPTIFRPSGSLLLEAARRADESSRDVA